MPDRDNLSRFGLKKNKQMEIKCLGSSSSGNCYVVGDENEQLIIEAGVSFHKVEEALNFNLSGARGVLISHEHG